MIGGYWFSASRRDPRVVALYGRHYSSKKGRRDTRLWLAHGIAGPGDDLTLLTPSADALFVWLKSEHREDGQTGVDCAVFRNESALLSSLLIAEADELAWAKWPGERHFTHVDPAEVRHKRDPGRCFRKAARRPCGSSKSGLLVLERLP